MHGVSTPIYLCKYFAYLFLVMALLGGFIFYLSVQIQPLFSMQLHPRFRRHVIPHLRQTLVVTKVRIARLTVALLRHNDHSQTFGRELADRLRGKPVELGSVEQHYHICILFYRPTLTQVVQLGTMAAARLTVAV